MAVIIPLNEINSNTTTIMKLILIKRLSLIACLGVFSLFSANAQSPENSQIIDYFELKGLLLKHKTTVERILSLQRFTLTSSRKRPESTIHIFQKQNDTTQILVRIREKDGLVNEVAWHESSSTLGNLTHDAVYDGFVPVNGNSKYQNRFENMLLLVGYAYAESKTVPCVIRSTQ